LELQSGPHEALLKGLFCIQHLKYEAKENGLKARGGSSAYLFALFKYTFKKQDSNEKENLCLVRIFHSHINGITN